MVVNFIERIELVDRCDDGARRASSKRVTKPIEQNGVSLGSDLHASVRAIAHPSG
jgi:hypothetical protein